MTSESHSEDPRQRVFRCSVQERQSVIHLRCSIPRLINSSRPKSWNTPSTPMHTPRHRTVICSFIQNVTTTEKTSTYPTCIYQLYGGSVSGLIHTHLAYKKSIMREQKKKKTHQTIINYTCRRCGCKHTTTMPSTASLEFALGRFTIHDWAYHRITNNQHPNLEILLGARDRSQLRSNVVYHTPSHRTCETKSANQCFVFKGS